jgi:hypothetical protein
MKKLTEINYMERGRGRTELQSVRTDKGKIGGRKKETKCIEIKHVNTLQNNDRNDSTAR